MSYMTPLMGEQFSYQAPELSVWSIAAEQGFAVSIDPDSDFQEVDNEDWNWN